VIDHVLTEEERLDNERRAILLRIAGLDDRLDSGQISHEEHEESRRTLKEKAVKITEALRNIDKP
jgi:hypothetical protein